MNNKEFITELARRGECTQEKAQHAAKALITEMGKVFEDEDTVVVSGFGSFEVKKRLERIVINPATKQRMLVPPKMVLNFKPTTTVKEKFKKGGDKDE